MFTLFNFKTKWGEIAEHVTICLSNWTPHDSILACHDLHMTVLLRTMKCIPMSISSNLETVLL